MKRLSILLLVLILALGGCAAEPGEAGQKQYTATFLDLFDTVTTIIGFAPDEDAFREKAQAVYDDLLVYHRLFDIYEEYEGTANLKTINDMAGAAPVAVDPIIIDLLIDCRDYYAATGGKVNTAMGGVLYLWHEAREDGVDDPANAYLPDAQALSEAAQHASFDDIVIDEENGTVFIADGDLRLDVGAIAKGWAVARVAEKCPEGLLISVGGNVCATGPKAGGTPWVIGIQDPDGGEYLHTIYLEKGCVVTSGDYQRAYMVDGELYHHIIDPDTLYPAKYWRAVTVVCEDSGDADALSTALFLLPLEEGQALLEKFGAEAVWVAADGQMYYSPGFSAMIRT